MGKFADVLFSVVASVTIPIASFLGASDTSANQTFSQNYVEPTAVMTVANVDESQRDFHKILCDFMFGAEGSEGGFYDFLEEYASDRRSRRENEERYEALSAALSKPTISCGGGSKLSMDMSAVLGAQQCVNGALTILSSFTLPQCDCPDENVSSALDSLGSIGAIISSVSSVLTDINVKLMGLLSSGENYLS